MLAKLTEKQLCVVKLLAKGMDIKIHICGNEYKPGSRIFTSCTNTKKKLGVHSTIEICGLLGCIQQNMPSSLKFTPRGKEIFLLIIAEMTDMKIAEHLGICYNRVRRHREKMLLENNCKNMIELIAKYYSRCQYYFDGDNMIKQGNIVILSTPEEILPLILEAIRISGQDKKDNATENASKKFLTSKDIEQEFGIHQKMLAYWRSEGIGPHYTSIGRRVYYERIDVENFFASGKVQTTGCVDK